MFIFRTCDRFKIKDASGARLVSPKGLSLIKRDKSANGCNSSLVLLSIIISLWIFGCNENRYTQCEQIFQIAHNVTNNTQKINSTSSQKPQEIKSWLKAAALMTSAAQQIRSLPIYDTELIRYQTGLANIYQIYSQATYDAVKARESKNLEALIAARSHAATANQQQQLLVDEINAYCLNDSSSL